MSKKSANTVRLRRAETSNEDLDVDMTSTGINRAKKQEIERKKRRFAGFKNDLKKDNNNKK